MKGLPFAMWNVSCVFEKDVWECCVGFAHTEGLLRSTYTLRTLPQPWHPAGVCQAKTARKAETIEEEDKRHKGCVWREEVKCVMEKLQGGCVLVWMSWWTEWDHSYTHIPEDYVKVSRRHSMDIWKRESTTKNVVWEWEWITSTWRENRELFWIDHILQNIVFQN